MYRCIALFITLTVTGLLPLAAQAQSVRQFPQTALRGVMTFGEPPEVVLNSAPARLAPGARVRGTNGMFALSGTLTGNRYTVHYALEKTTGLVKEVWILTDEERANKPWPTKPEHTETWSFDAGTQTWTKP